MGSTLGSSSILDGSSSGSRTRSTTTTSLRRRRRPCAWKTLPMSERLVVLTVLGQGASSVVYKAFDLVTLRIVALKVSETAGRHGGGGESPP